MKIIVLGSGTSHGIPVVGCSCPVCTSNESKDKRMRSSIYIEGSGGERALIDAGPEFRLQALRSGITALDGIFLTHSHADHIHGLDDVRPLSWKKPLPVYGNDQTITEMRERFAYVFCSTAQRGGGKPNLLPRVVDGPVRIGSLTFTPVPVKHGVLDILGWEVGENASKSAVSTGKTPSERIVPSESDKSFLYLTDTSAIPPSSLKQIRPSSRRVVIIGGLRARPHETHFSFGQALEAALDLDATEAYLTHLSHDHSHAEVEAFCRRFAEGQRDSGKNLEGVTLHPAWDGLEISL